MINWNIKVYVYNGLYMVFGKMKEHGNLFALFENDFCTL